MPLFEWNWTQSPLKDDLLYYHNSRVWNKNSAAVFVASADIFCAFLSYCFTFKISSNLFRKPFVLCLVKSRFLLLYTFILVFKSDLQYYTSCNQVCTQDLLTFFCCSLNLFEFLHLIETVWSPIKQKTLKFQ